MPWNGLYNLTELICEICIIVLLLFVSPAQNMPRQLRWRLVVRHFFGRLPLDVEAVFLFVYYGLHVEMGIIRIKAHSQQVTLALVS